MPDPIADFFARLADRGAGPPLGDLTGTMRFDVTQPDPVRHWRLAVDHGRAEVTDSAADADCVLAASRPVLEDLVTGRRNAMAAVLRGQLGVTGDPGLLVRIQQLFPSSGAPARAEPHGATRVATAGDLR